MAEPNIHEAGQHNNEAINDIIFVHGLGGDWRTTWQSEDHNDSWWPLWLKEQLTNANIWSLNYPANATKWTSEGSEMPLPDRAANILDFLVSKNYGNQNIFFIAHSLGGLLVKQILNHAYDIPKWNFFIENTKGVAFIATPHSGSDLANLASALNIIFRSTISTEELKANSPYLRDLGNWYSQNANKLDIKTCAYSENERISNFLVVDQSSSDPRVEDCITIPIDGNHFTICKPKSKESPLYTSIRNFLEVNMNQEETRQERKMKKVIIIIDRLFAGFSDDEARTILQYIGNKLELDGKLKIKNKLPGSVKLEVELPLDDAKKLVLAIKSGLFRDYNVIDAEMTEIEYEWNIDSPYKTDSLGDESNLFEQLLSAGVHFGHLTRRWNPKMKPFIFMEKNGIHIMDLKKTVNSLEDACNAISQIVANGEKVLFVGTKKQAKMIVKAEAVRAGVFYVTERWLGGMLTNFSTIRKSIKHMKNIEKKESDGTFEKITKKERLMLERAKLKLKAVLEGIEDMRQLPGAVFVVDTKKEHIAVKEANILGIPVFAIVDTNCDPDQVQFVIPGNDDAAKSIQVITKTIADAVVDASRHVIAVTKDAPAEVDNEKAKRETQMKYEESRQLGKT